MYQKRQLKNGVRVITAPMRGTKTATVLVLVGTGSKNETKKNNGISHFMEHMFFKGTKKRPTMFDITKELDRIGGAHNAFTSKEVTGYWAKVDSRHLDIALDVLSDMFINSQFSPAKIKKEKGTILEEINMYLDTPMRFIPDLFEQLLYQNQSIGRGILGTKNNVKSFRRKDFVDYYQNYYTGENTIVVVAGDVNNNDVYKKVSKYFRAVKKSKLSEKSKSYDKQNKPALKLQYKKTDQSHLCLGVRGYGVSHKDKYALDILSVILGGNMSSRLSVEIIEKRGMAYFIYTDNENYQDVGYLVAHSGLNNNRLEEAIKIILREYKKLTRKKVGEEEIRRAKDYIKGKSLIALESSDAVANFVGHQEIATGKILTIQEKFAKLEAVTADDLRRVARDIFVNEKLNLALIGPFKNKKRFENILKF